MDENDAGADEEYQMTPAAHVLSQRNPCIRPEPGSDISIDGHSFAPLSTDRISGVAGNLARADRANVKLRAKSAG